MAYFCYSCGKDLSGEVERGKAGRSQSCPKCTRDLHACRNCKHYDPNAYNSCRESNAERQVDKEKANFCDYFSFLERGSFTKAEDKKADVLKNLDDLFKK